MKSQLASETPDRLPGSGSGRPMSLRAATAAASCMPSQSISRRRRLIKVLVQRSLAHEDIEAKKGRSVEDERTAGKENFLNVFD